MADPNLRSDDPTATSESPVWTWGHEPHRHDVDQFVFLASGDGAMTTDAGQHRLDADTALWIPADVEHSARFSEDAVVLPLLLWQDPRGEADRPDLATDVVVTRPLRQVMLTALRATIFGSVDDEIRRRIAVTVYRALDEGAGVRLPSSPAAQAVARELLDDPAEHATLAQWARRFYISETTLARAFRNETGLSWTQWRARVRMHRAVELLDGGLSVSTVASRVGFDSTNGFILAFRREYGYTPGVHASTSVPASA